MGTKLIGIGKLRTVPAAQAQDSQVKNFDEVYPNDPGKEDAGFIEGERPAAELFNYMLRTLFADLNWIKFSGINGWRNDISYNTGCVVSWANNVYIAATDNINKQPSINSPEWVVLSKLKDVALRTINLTAGNGLSGGGNLSGNRRFDLGTPSTCSLSSQNNVTSGSHTHAIDIPVGARGVTGVVSVVDALGYNRDAVPSQQIVTQTRDTLSQTDIDNRNEIFAKFKRRNLTQPDEATFYRFPGSYIDKVLGTRAADFGPGDITDKIYMRNDSSNANVRKFFTTDINRASARDGRPLRRVNGTWMCVGAGLEGNDFFEYSFEKLNDD